jgi:hypothetical protein
MCHITPCESVPKCAHGQPRLLLSPLGMRAVHLAVCLPAVDCTTRSRTPFVLLPRVGDTRDGDVTA